MIRFNLVDEEKTLTPETDKNFSESRRLENKKNAQIIVDEAYKEYKNISEKAGEAKRYSKK